MAETGLCQDIWRRMSTSPRAAGLVTRCSPKGAACPSSFNMTLDRVRVIAELTIVSKFFVILSKNATDK